MEKTASSLVELIPQVTYDIIGRVIPGTVIILTWAITWLGPSKAFGLLGEYLADPDFPITLWTFLLFAVIAYILSIVLYGITKVPSLFRKKPDEEEKIDPEKPSAALKYDAIRVASPEAGARLVKLSAEQHAAQILITGWLLAGSVNLYLLIASFSVERLFLGIVLAFALVGIYSFYKYIRTGFQKNLNDHWYILYINRSFSAPPEHGADTK
ncbi:MAG: hypothetical protein JXJ17_08955 [Anaerolineae bacterium]|nr:hypothetical protein [Anaerolineae bacterium]